MRLMLVALLPWFNNSVHRLRTTVFAQCSGGNYDDDDDGYGYGDSVVVVRIWWGDSSGDGSDDVAGDNLTCLDSTCTLIELNRKFSPC